jgi:hypothetical protein
VCVWGGGGGFVGGGGHGGGGGGKGKGGGSGSGSRRTSASPASRCVCGVCWVEWWAASCHHPVTISHLAPCFACIAKCVLCPAACLTPPPTTQPGAVPVLTKPVTAELGNITPYIIVPGPWSERDIEYHATNVASGLAQNTGHNCISAEVSFFQLKWHKAQDTTAFKLRVLCCVWSEQ